MPNNAITDQVEPNEVFTSEELQRIAPAGVLVTLVPTWTYLAKPFLRGRIADAVLSSDGAYVHRTTSLGHHDMWAPVSALHPADPELVVRCSAFAQGQPPSWLHVHRSDEGALDAICAPCFHVGHLSRATSTTEPWGNRFGCSCCGRSTFTSIGD